MQLSSLVFPALGFVAAAGKAIYDPTNGAAVATVGEATALFALERLQRVMMADRTGRSLLLHRPLLTDQILEEARGMEENSFGRRYAQYMDYNHFTPNGRTPVQHIADPTLAYIMTRYRQCHDFLHTVTGCGRTVDEEVAVKLLEYQHTGLPLGLLAVLGGAPHMTPLQRQRVCRYWSWAEANKPCQIHHSSDKGGERERPCYLNVPWEEMLPLPYETVVQQVGIAPLKEYLEKIQ